MILMLFEFVLYMYSIMANNFINSGGLLKVIYHALLFSEWKLYIIPIFINETL